MTDFLDSFLRQGVFLSLSERTLLVGWGRLEFTSNPPLDRVCFFAPDFFLKKSTLWICPEFVQEVSIRSFPKAGPPQVKALSPGPQLYWKGPSRGSFDKTILDLRKEFSNGSLQKAVPVVFETANVVEGFHRNAFLNLLSWAGPFHLYGFWNEGEGVLGATPEILFEAEGRFLKTMALAGTTIDGKWTEKEKKEHQMVVEDIQSALSPYGEVETGGMGERDCFHFRHLKTEMLLFSKVDLFFEELISSLHPTAAVGAYPRAEGWKWLLENDPKGERGRFGAPFAALRPGRKNKAVVAIRNIQWKGNQVRLGAGCGVIAESDTEKEWQELCWKRNSVKKMMGL